MQTSKIIQAVILMLVLAMAASCAAGRQYSSRVFAPKQPAVKDSQHQAVRFLNFGEEEDSLDLTKPVLVIEKEPVKKDSVSTATRDVEKTKPAPVPEPVVKTGTTGGVRTKKTRDDQ